LKAIFERRDRETVQAYEAARVYFELRAERSVIAVGKKLRKDKSLMSRWSMTWNWVERARAYDASFDLEVGKAIAEAARKIAQEWEGRENALRERMYETHLRSLDIVDKMLAFPLATITTKTVEGADGQIIHQTTVEPTRWTFDTTIRMSTAAFAMARRAIRNEGAAGPVRKRARGNWMTAV
jgi:uncharacterized membrane protein YqiK